MPGDPDDIFRLERAIERLGRDIRGEMATLRDEVKKASSFQVGFQAVSRTLTYVCIIAAAAATIYASLLRKG